MNPLHHTIFICGLAVAAHCSGFPAPGADDSVGTTGVRQFQVRGVVRSWNTAEQTLTIAHDEIPGFMPAMVMPFVTSEPLPLPGIHPGDRVEFRLLVTASTSRIDSVHHLAAGMAAVPIPRPAITQFTPGDRLPDVSLVDEQGRCFSSGELRGHPFALTFIFTRCPLPNFCPLLSSRFRHVQNALGASAGSRSWRLLSITLDPEFDTVERLRSYAHQQQAAPTRWNFATGEPAQIAALAAACGIETKRPGADFTHTLRTIVFDDRGRAQRIFNGNDWPVETLVEEMIEAVRNASKNAATADRRESNILAAPALPAGPEEK